MDIKDLLLSNNTEFIIEAHDGLSAIIAERSGFSGLWASGFAISAACGLRDCNELSWSQLLNVVSYMTNAVTIPVLIDADTGFGNYNNFRKFVINAEKIGASGACIEDKVFPKNNSFDNTGSQNLASISEFVGKIRAAKDSVHSNFSIVARTEGYISGLDTDQVIERASAYAEAGADAIVVHSRQSTDIEIKSFMKKWTSNTPIVVIPTSYYNTSIEEFRQLNISMVILANYNIRAASYYMKKISEALSRHDDMEKIVKGVSSMQEIFELVDLNELKDANMRYL